MEFALSSTWHRVDLLITTIKKFYCIGLTFKIKEILKKPDLLKKLPGNFFLFGKLDPFVDTERLFHHYETYQLTGFVKDTSFGEIYYSWPVL